MTGLTGFIYSVNRVQHSIKEFNILRFHSIFNKDFQHLRIRFTFNKRIQHST